MKRFMQLIVTICLAFSARTFAALANSESEIAELFGNPVEQGFPDKNGVTTNTYQKGNYVILVQFLRHLSLAESYTRVDQQEFSEKEISAFLEGSSNGRIWNKDPNKLEWERSDHKARAWSQTIHGRPTLLLTAQ
jgi:hypothetical protein